MLINEYRLSYPGATSKLVRDTSRDKTDLDVLKEHHRFLWEEEDEEAADGDSWGKRLAKKYYDKLFKEYGICDLSKYKENKIAMRWRTEKEVVEGKGQFSCGEKRCDETRDLRSWEVNFGYVEEGAKKNALVKMRKLKCSIVVCITITDIIFRRTLPALLQPVELSSEEKGGQEEKQDRQK